MTTVTNNTANPFALPYDGAQPIPVGATVEVEQWADIKDHPLVAKLVKAKLLTTGAKVGEVESEDGPDHSPDVQLANLNAQQVGESAPVPAPRGRRVAAQE